MAAKLKFVFLSVALGIFLTASAAFADSCPYCGQDYGDPMPGDEARVYALRREHEEAMCPMRPREIKNDSGFDNSWAAQQQQWVAQQERIRSEQEQAGRRRIEEEARKSAEAQRKRVEWEKKKTDLMAALKGAVPGDVQLKTDGEEIELKPKDTDFFSLKKHEEGMGIKAPLLSPARRQEPSSSALDENLRRALWLYQKAAQTRDPEEARFLSEEADEAVPRTTKFGDTPNSKIIRYVSRDNAVLTFPPKN